VADSAAEARIDQSLVARVLLGDDRRAFEQLVRRHQGMVRAQLCRLLHGDQAAADDLAQETFLLAWRKLDQFRSEARFSTWLHRIAYACFLQACRTKSWARANVSAEVRAPLMISTSGIRSTGEKKCTPMKFAASFDCSANDVIGKVEVFDPNTTLSPTTACAFAVASAFTLRSSNTASMIMSTPFSAS